MIRLVIRTIALATLAGGCSLMGVPRTADSAAPRDAHAQWKQAREASDCDRKISVLHSEAEVLRAFQRLATISSTCSPGAPSVCEHHLKERACELNADAIVLDDSGSGSAPWGSSSSSLVSMSARAVRWTD